MTLEHYKQRLEKHDWYYMMSDDPRIYDAGKAEKEELKRIAAKDPKFMEAYQEKEESIRQAELAIRRSK